MSKHKSQTAEFSLVGKLLGFVIKAGYKIKYLRLTASDQEYWIKLPKELRHHLNPAIIPGCCLEIRGTSKLCLKTGKIKLKADLVQLLPQETPSQGEMVCQISAKPAQASILICQKSSCWKRGGKAICQALADGLRDRGLTDRVQIKRTGCLKQCKQGPNLVILPDRARYSQVKPQQIPALLEKHFFLDNV